MSESEIFRQAYFGLVNSVGIVLIIGSALGEGFHREFDAYEAEGLEIPEELYQFADKVTLLLITVPILVFVFEVLVGLGKILR